MSNLHPVHKINKFDDVAMHVTQPFLPALKLEIVAMSPGH